MDMKNGLTFSNDGDLHGIGHGGVGGEASLKSKTLLCNANKLQMMDVFNSVNDPIFWLHHSGIDRMWSLWQEQDPANRAMEVGGATGFFDLAPLKNETPVWVGGMAPDVPAIQVMDPQNRDGRGVLCYKYEGLTLKDYLPSAPVAVKGT
jgi:tyrosinase